MHSSLSIIIVLMLTLSSMTEASPKERLKVKYKVKTGGKREGQRLKVAQEVMEDDSDSSLDYLNTVETHPPQARTQPTSPSYKEVVTTMMGQLERAARSQDLTIGDLVFDIVKEVIAETLGGLVTRGLGLGTGRSGGEEFSLIGSVMRAVAKVGNGSSC
eukprot:TRINITY_DN11408_c0_g1_i4.p1 TRINITY_DN11408_c0_g1~~TRINITY_DN11408_c0_g1_i4.p1  ORF type:complete len:159 (-),score=52.31 TRINITY_DN11408_c0_g1_i4:16-492(-)